MLITLKNGQREFENGMTPLEIAGQTEPGAEKAGAVRPGGRQDRGAVAAHRP